MKIHKDIWYKTSAYYKNNMLEIAREAVKYNYSNEPMNINLQRKFDTTIKIFKRIGLFEMEAEEPYKEQLSIFYDFCEEILKEAREM